MRSQPDFTRDLKDLRFGQACKCHLYSHLSSRRWTLWTAKTENATYTICCFRSWLHQRVVLQGNCAVLAGCLPSSSSQCQLHKLYLDLGCVDQPHALPQTPCQTPPSPLWSQATPCTLVRLPRNVDSSLGLDRTQKIAANLDEPPQHVTGSTLTVDSYNLPGSAALSDLASRIYYCSVRFGVWCFSVTRLPSQECLMPWPPLDLPGPPWTIDRPSYPPQALSKVQSTTPVQSCLLATFKSLVYIHSFISVTHFEETHFLEE